MRSKPYLLIVAMLACLALAGGCGGDDNGGGGDSNNSSDSSGGSTSNDANVQQIIDSCKRSVNAAQSLSSAAKKDLNDLCEKAGSGDEEAARKASQDVCVRIVKDTVPAGPARDQAVDACKQTTQ
jgi:hypothetical protein